MQNLKSSLEISLIEKACRLTDRTFDYILKKINPGITERELSLEIQRFLKRNNAGISFRPIVAFGKNSASPHHKPNETKLKKGDIVLLDFGAKVNNYCSDMTRTVFFGKPVSEQKRIYQTVLEAQKLAIEFLYNRLVHYTLPIKAKDVDKVAHNYITSAGFPTMPHGLGHGVGRKVHEPPKISPKSRAILKPGMVFSIEPGIYIKDFGGVRIEDLVVLEKTGLTILTRTKRGLIEL